MQYLSKAQTAEIFQKYGKDAKNTGSIEGQIALCTERIKHLTAHLETNKKDFSTQRGLLRLVGRRRRLLTYLRNTRLDVYRELIVELGLRK